MYRILPNDIHLLWTLDLPYLLFQIDGAGGTPQKDIKIPQALTIFPHETWWDCYTLYVQWQAVVCQSPLPTYKSEIQLDESK